MRCLMGTMLEVGARVIKNHAAGKLNGWRLTNARIIRINTIVMTATYGIVSMSRGIGQQYRMIIAHQEVLSDG